MIDPQYEAPASGPMIEIERHRSPGGQAELIIASWSTIAGRRYALTVNGRLVDPGRYKIFDDRETVFRWIRSNRYQIAGMRPEIKIQWSNNNTILHVKGAYAQLSGQWLGVYAIWSGRALVSHTPGCPESLIHEIRCVWANEWHRRHPCITEASGEGTEAERDEAEHREAAACRQGGI